MIKLKDILTEVMNTYQVEVTLITDRGVGITNILDQIRGLEKLKLSLKQSKQYKQEIHVVFLTLVQLQKYFEHLLLK